MKLGALVLASMMAATEVLSIIASFLFWFVVAGLMIWVFGDMSKDAGKYLYDKIQTRRQSRRQAA